MLFISAADYHPRMKPPKHNRTITPADEAAAARLRSLWEARAKIRPTQEEMAGRLGGSSQSLTSQYLNTKIALNYKAVLAFASALGCSPEAIRDDLPEQALAKETATSQPMRNEADRIDARRNELGLSYAAVHARMLALHWPEGVKPPDIATVTDWFDGRRRPLDMQYREMLYRALDMGTGDDVPMDDGVAKTELGARLLQLAESGDPDEAAQMLALWETMRRVKKTS